MQLLNSNFASSLQFVSLPLELIGLTLATIEVRFPILTSRINAYLESQVHLWGVAKTQIKQKHPFVYKLHGGDSRWHIPMPALVYHTLTALVAVIAVAAILFLSARALHHFDLIDAIDLDTVSSLYDAFFFWVYLPISGVAMIALGVTFIAVKFVANRAVGTLGIIIASVGVLGEGYQLLVQLST